MNELINKKKYKYNKKKTKLVEIFKEPKNGTFIILSQLIGINGAKFDKLKKYGKENNLKIEYLNYKKMKNIFVEGQDFVNRMNNEMLIIKGTNYTKEIGAFLKYLTQEDLEEKVIILTVLLENHKGYKEFSLEELKKRNITVANKDEALLNFYKMLKIKVMSIQMKLIKVINGNNKSNKE
jgi:hypothetical protein